MILNTLALRHALVLQLMMLPKGDAVANGFFKNYMSGLYLTPLPLALG